MKQSIVLLFAWVFPAMLSAQLGPEQRFIHPSGGTALGIHDLDSDGDGDILRAAGSGGLLVHEQVAENTFNVTRNLGPAEGFNGISFGDIDGDGIDDVLLAKLTGSVAWVQVLGGGNYAPIEHLLNAIGPVESVDAADLDGDLDLDLVFAYNPGILQTGWAENLGGATFGPPQSIAGGAFFGMADIDMDGDVDIALAGLEWLENDGSGSFTAHAITTFSGSAVLGDIDGDLDPDILLSGNSTCVFHMRNDGSGAFAPQDTAMLIGGPEVLLEDMRMADREGDGDLDLYGWYPGNIGISNELITGINDGTGYFELGPAVVSADFNEPYALGLVNGDAATDVVSFANDAFRLYNSSTGAGIRLNSVMGPKFLARYGSDILVCGPVFSSPTTEGPSPLQLAAHAISGGEVSQMPQELWVSASPIQRVDTAELDGIGALDLVAQWTEPLSGTNKRHMWMSGTDSIGPIGDLFWNMLTGPILPLIRDLDLDGDKDVAYYAWSTVSVNLQPFGVEQDHTLSFWYQPSSVTLCNVDLDGYPDFVWTHSSPDSIIWVPNDGTGAPGTVQYAQPSPIGVIPPESGQASPVLSTYDLDADGLEDVIIFNGESIALMRNTGGALSTLQTFPCAATAFAVADMDDDGFPDIVALRNNGDIIAWLNLGNGMMGGALTLATGPDHTGRTHLILTDINADGAPDVVTCAQTGSAAWLENLFNSPYAAHGHIWHDANADGIADPGEDPLPFILAACDPSSGFPMTDTTGAYSFALSPGLFTLSSLAPDTLWTLTSDSSQYHIELTAQDPVSTGNDFGYTPAVVFTHVEPTLVVNTGVCSGYSTLFLQTTNLGTTIPDAHLTLQLDTAFSYVNASPEPDSINGQTIHWTLDSVYFYSSQGIVLMVTGPDTAMMGLPASNTLTLEAIVDGAVEQTSVVTWADTITCSYDPNDKQVSPAGYGAHGAVDIGTGYLDYTIRFQNTGNAPAVDVIIRDALDQDLDPTSLVFLGHSHLPSEVSIRPDGVLEFHFEGINLPDSGADFVASQGFVRYRIALRPDLPDLTTIENAALIFFDLNAPVTTNTVINTLVDCNLFSAEISWGDVDSLVATAGEHYQWYFEGDSILGADEQWLIVPDPGSYMVEVTSIHGCTNMSDAYEVIFTGIRNEARAAIMVVPNPSSGDFTILSSEVLDANDRIELVDQQGRVVRSERGTGSSEVRIMRAGLQAGVYVLRVISQPGSTLTAKLVVF